MLLDHDPQFNWDTYIKNMTEEFNGYGFRLDIKPRKNLDRLIKSTFLKADSLIVILGESSGSTGMTGVESTWKNKTTKLPH